MATKDKADSRRDRAKTCMEATTTAYSAHLIEINRHLEDLDNRGRRNNIRVWGVPETIGPNQLRPALTSIFNNIMEKPADLPI